MQHKLRKWSQKTRKETKSCIQQTTNHIVKLDFSKPEENKVTIIEEIPLGILHNKLNLTYLRNIEACDELSFTTEQAMMLGSYKTSFCTNFKLDWKLYLVSFMIVV